MGRHYDLTYLQQVFHGNDVMVQKIVKLFLDQGPQFGRDMTECVRKSNWRELHPIAHKLKSSVNMLGMSDLLPFVLEIEQRSKFGEGVESLPQLVANLNANLELVCMTLSHDLEEVLNRKSSPDSGLRRA